MDVYIPCNNGLCGLLRCRKGNRAFFKNSNAVVYFNYRYLHFYTTIKDENTGRTGLEGFLIYIKPNLNDITKESGGIDFIKIMNLLLDAMSQLFFSLSVAMGIMITYGSYVKKDVDLGKSVKQIEIFDTIIAFLAGIMVVPAVHIFNLTESISEGGPGVIFVILPQVLKKWDLQAV